VVDLAAYHIGRAVVPLIAELIADSELRYGLNTSDLKMKSQAFAVCIFLNFVALDYEIVLL
jgi:hypothetical protein